MGLYAQHVESWHSLGGAAAPRVIVILAGLVDGSAPYSRAGHQYLLAARQPLFWIRSAIARADYHKKSVAVTSNLEYSAAIAEAIQIKELLRFCLDY